MNAAHADQAAARENRVGANPLRATLAGNRHRTAISRTDYSRPIRGALADGVIGPGATVLDYGCGLGDDVRHLGLHGTESWGWDPAHLPDGSRAPAQVVNLGYVVNVIEDADERAKCLACAWACAERVLIVSARLASQTRDFTPVGRFADGFVTSVPTFQKLYHHNELKRWIESQLGEPAVAGGPGVFYVFRDPADRMGYLANRFRRSSRASPPSVASSIEAHKELLQPLVAFFHAHARVPGDDEIANAAEIRERLGSLRRALRLIERAHDPGQWHRVITARAHDLLLFLALARFDGRPRFGQLPLTLRRDIKSLFPSYRQACAEADVALRAVGNLRRISRAAERSTVGKRTPSALYVHDSALDALPPLLRLYEGCARSYIGRIEGANLIKLHTDEPIISYLSYPDFESDPHPQLDEATTVHLQTFRVRERHYRASKNPPILHRKELFLPPDHPLRAKFARLTRHEESKGLFEDSSRIGTRYGWEQCLRERGFALKGHRLVHRPRALDNSTPAGVGT
ncbi:MAG: DNA phosphorothioation-associated putative methyltransferase [Gammaproteobacteria bacterium]|nr:DNA phosphorothioation-associated putative methyltransferase [Gammaproteobacteria bacterium]